MISLEIMNQLNETVTFIETFIFLIEFIFTFYYNPAWYNILTY